MLSRITKLKGTRSGWTRRVPAGLSAALLAMGALASGCTIEVVNSPAAQPKAPPPPQAAAPAAAPAPAPAQPQAAPQQSTGNQELTGLHSGVAANVATVRGLVDAVGAAVRDPGLSAESKRAHDGAFPKVRSARQSLNGGNHRAAEDEAGEAKRLLAPAVDELSGKAKVPDAVLKLLVAQADESTQSVAGAMQALKATGNTTGIDGYERAAAAFADAAVGARAGHVRRALRGLVEGSGQLERGIIARWPSLNVR